MGSESRTNVTSALERFFTKYVEACQQAGDIGPRLPFEPQWTSPCQDGEPRDDGTIHWRPRLRYPSGDFTGVETALELTLHDDIKAFYGTYFSETIKARSSDGELDLIQVWNRADQDRLLENVIGHLLAKRRARLSPTVFIAQTDEEEYFLSIDNETGEVLLETPGLAPLRAIAPDVATFIDSLTPLTVRPTT
ncbi:MAG: SecY-interacting protein [Pseudomonadota bacterium]